MVHILERDARIAEVVRIRERIGGVVVADLRQTLNVTRAASHDVHRRLGVVHASSIRDGVVDRQEALGVVHVAEYGKVDTVFVEKGFERCLACCARIASCGCVPGAVTANHNPGGNAAVHGS